MNVNKRILILCEDEKSSRNYFNSFKADEKLKRKLSGVSVEVHHPVNYSPLGLVKEAKEKIQMAKEERNKYDEVWVVLDKDKHSGIAEAFNMAKDNKIEFGLSIICFELWVLLHYKKTKKAFTNCDELIKHLKNGHYPGYLKAKNCFDDLKELIPVAIKNGEWLEKENLLDIQRGIKIYELSSYTNLHKLVKKLYYPDLYLILD